MNHHFPSSIYVSHKQSLALEDAQMEAYHERIAKQNEEQECAHESHMGTCIGCGEEMAPEDRYVGADELRQPHDVLSISDLNVIYELVAVATGALERLARENPLDAQSHLGNITRFREFNARVQRR